MHDLSKLRREYSKESLDVSTILSDPIEQFGRWFHEAIEAEVLEPNAMNLSTINEDNRPSSRIVLLKGVEEKKFVFYTNYQSTKGKELTRNPACALTFFWPELERQVRIEGTAERVDDERSEKYFQSRPRSSQIGAWTSPQSTIIEARSILEERALQIEKRFEGMALLPKPKQWGGFQVDPLVIEFWQGRPSRLHDRIQFAKVDGVWKVYRLAP
ncbi:pyridoxamine 5'-phosphate oxidase [Chryseolinea sp. H1M3-3]|uniref:pyridoxamine 5'-phosphate oxidase n=1 Tax=Chryseolinea sp. H1M3-3 TaxID=3034144 RepID=UPI0023EBD794|nr:pyridoxamine 5'-phosphate oxidase [Chryseolinea sp. H1M3-3]